MTTKRTLGMLPMLLGIGLGAGIGVSAPALAQTKEVKIGLIAPMSGPWARQGDLMLKGAKLAIDDINTQGGIKALGGAKLKLVVFDAGRQHREGQERRAAHGRAGARPDRRHRRVAVELHARRHRGDRARGAAVLTLSYSDQITARGFKYVFQTSLDRRRAGQSGAVRRSSSSPRARPARSRRRSASCMDNTAASVSFAKPMREGGLAKLGLKLVVDETFTPPLSDCTPLIQKVRSARPDILLLLPTAISGRQAVRGEAERVRAGSWARCR